MKFRMQHGIALSIIFLAPFLFLGCASTGEKAYNQGRYDTAVLQAVQKLRKDPTNEIASGVLPNAYAAARDQHLRTVESARATQAPFRGERIVDAYAALNRLATEIRHSPAALQLVEPTQYVRELDEAKSQAASVRLEAGKAALAKSSTNDAREAVEHFLVAQELVPNLRGVGTLLAQAQEAATIRVLLEPVSCPTEGVDTGFLETELRTFLNQSRQQYIRYYSPFELSNAGLKADQIITISFAPFASGREKQTESSREYSQDNVIIGRSSSNPPSDILGTVKATAIVYTREISATTTLHLKIHDHGGVLLTKKLPCTALWQDHWGSYRGDERALPGNVREQCEQNSVPAPSQQDLFVRATEGGFEQACEAIRHFHR
jgi:hypothetical protein